MKLIIAKLKFTTPVHFGQTGIGIENIEEIVHSDTLFSALCHSWASIYGKSDLDALLERFKTQPPFLVSSCFVYNNGTYFLPKPHTIPPGFELVEIREKYSKDIKEVNYIPQEIFQLWAQRKEIDYETISKEFPPYTTSYGFALLPRVTLDRKTSTSQLFHYGIIKFNKNCGLYCLIKFNDETLEKKVQKTFSFLGELGLGGERSTGLGKFNLEWEEAGKEWDSLISSEGNSFCTLSLFHPENLEDIETLIENASYTLIERRGWLHSPFNQKQYKKKTVTMFQEGSVFSKPITGHLVDVTPQIWIKEGNPHPIYRYGLAFTIPIKKDEG